ncbi:hypothetical protein [Ralstonia pseudosolanacearum]
MKNGRYEEEIGTFYFQNDELHREDGPAAIYKSHFYQDFYTTLKLIDKEEWWINGQKHRDDGPAVIFYLMEEVTRYEWWVNGLLHREDGPAWETVAGDKNRWFLYGLELTKEKFNQWLEKKALNEKLQATLEPRPKYKKKKI